MSKPAKIIIILCVTISSFWIIGRATDAFQFYRASSLANLPTIGKGDLFFASNLINPRKNNLVSYLSETLEFGKQIWIHRLCGTSGDTILIISGTLYVNGKNFDSSLNLCHDYLVSKREIETVRRASDFPDELITEYSGDSVIIPISNKVVDEHRLKAKRLIMPETYDDEYIRSKYNKPWNQDFFGPYIVPYGSFFVIGDNRNRSSDSRYNGPVSTGSYRATVLWK